MNPNHRDYAEIVAGSFGVIVALAAWYTVVFPTPVVWRGNRAPLSMGSRIGGAVAVTAWCLAVFRVYPMYAAAIFAACLCMLGSRAAQKRRADDRMRIASGIRPAFITPRQRWLVLCFVDALLFTASGFALIRDWRLPPVTDEQHVLHVMALGMFAISAIGAIALLVNWSPKDD